MATMKFNTQLSIDSTTGHVETAGDLVGKKNGVFANLSTSADTTVTTAGDFTPIVGSFVNSPIQSFTTTPDPAISYTNTITQYFEIIWCASITASTNGTTVTISIKHNSSVLTGSNMSHYVKTAGELYNMNGLTVVELAQNDTIQLVCTSDGDGDVITFFNFLTSIKEFYD